MNNSTTYPIQTKQKHVQESPQAAVAVIITLILLGAVAGAIASFLILGLDALLAQLGNPTSLRFTQLIANIFRRMSDVLVVWFQAPVDGAIAGSCAGAAIGVTYLVTLWLGRTRTVFVQRPWLLYCVLALAGAVGAAAGSRGFLVDIRHWAALTGALYGVGAAYTIVHSRSERRSQ